MKIICSINALLIYLAASALQNACAFTTSKIAHGVRPLIQRNRNRMAPLYTNNDGSVDNLRDEIERMKKEARDKLNALDDKMSTMSNVSDDSNTVMESTVSNSKKSTSPLIPIKEDDETEEEYMERRLVERMAVSNNPAYTTVLPTSTRRRDEDLLDGTNWKLSFDIGREPGTWMPKDWGVSGDRLKLAFDFELSDQQLYEREDFLGSAGDAKVVSVKNSKMVLAPSITEGTKDIKVKNGGWRVSRGKGPMGSDLLRFYVEIEEQVSRKNGDVYCPAGRVYCSCGFFNMKRPGNGEKSRYKKKLDDLILRAEALDDEIAEAGFFDKLKKNAEMIRLKVQMQETAERYQGASVLEPTESILRFSPSGDVGLTKEGGVVCKVNKGVSIEYHILGRFYIQGAR
mmetsp:Transcript_26437/g.39163  ORF Transcript_26437/g.39163 Transcript_26437/m.39163 type:complete len:400 (-) Transcript_26437:58-1257(-)